MNEVDGTIANELHQKVAQNEEMRRALLMENMQMLSQLKTKNLYRAILGDERAPWSAYLGQLEVFYSRNEVNNYIRIYDKFINELGVDKNRIYKITRSRLFDLIPIINRENVDELLSMAEVLLSQDWVNEMRIRRGKTSIDECPHSFVEYEICQECGSKHKKSEAYHE